MTGNKLIGIVACGGQSSRMGIDKGRLIYHGQEQRYRVYHMLAKICDEVYISCNARQAVDLPAGFNLIVDNPSYPEIGPMAGLLSAFDTVQHADVLLLGCDYPYLDEKELRLFLAAIDRSGPATAFFNGAAAVYEPLLAYYGSQAAASIRTGFAEGQYSLQQWLYRNKAGRYLPQNRDSLKSIDTPAAAAAAQRHFAAEHK